MFSESPWFKSSANEEYKNISKLFTFSTMYFAFFIFLFSFILFEFGIKWTRRASKERALIKHEKEEKRKRDLEASK